MNLTVGDSFYYLYRSCYNPNDQEELYVNMKVVEKDGKKRAVSLSKKVNWISFEVTEKVIKDLTKEEFPHIFKTKEEAVKRYEKETEESVNGVLSLSKEELIRQMYQSWSNSGDGIWDVRYYEAMKEKIKREFQIEVE